MQPEWLTMPESELRTIHDARNSALSICEQVTVPVTAEEEGQGEGAGEGVGGRQGQGSVRRHGQPPRTGRVTLVGAGPGDPEYLTLRALRALRESDVILFDSLVSDEVLAFARSETRRILVGKRAGRPSCRQEEINTLMIRLAKAGHHVVRLKSGDPMVFGRAGEEIESVRRAQIPVSIVPGISAAQALACALGVSLTHRERAQSLQFVTGHSRQGGLPAVIDWRAVADPAITTVIYMGARLASDIVARLIGCGLQGDTPVAFGVALGRADEAVGYQRLDALERFVATVDPAHPIVIGVGAVFTRAAREAQFDESTAADAVAITAATLDEGLGRRAA